MNILENDENLKMARLLFERGDILQSVELLEAHHQSYLDKGTELYLECTNYLLRSYAELQDQAKINQLKETLNRWAREKGELTPRTYYTLALCESQYGNYDAALELCRKSLSLALAQNRKTDICYAITGLAIGYYQLGRLQEALKEIYNLQIFFDALQLPKLQLTALIVNAHIYRKLEKYPQAIEALWNCYEMIKDEKDLYTHFTLLYGLGLTYKESGDLDKARTYLELGVRSIDGKNMRRLHMLLSELLKEVQRSSKSPYDMIYDVQSHAIFEKTKGKIDFKNQFILLEMLKLFLGHPGRVFSKEELIETIWKQSYNPSVHDNKIYVTIKRLRKVIEPDYNKPKYIFLAKNGYYLSKDIKIQVRGIEPVVRGDALMLKLISATLLSLTILMSATSGYANWSPFSITNGGEIPWPLSDQRVVTVDNTAGLWRLENKLDTKIFNVEMISGEDGYDWVRVAELHPRTFRVISWGEAFFRRNSLWLPTQSSYGNITFGEKPPADHYGRYLDMFPNGDLTKDPYILRIVEVETSIGNVVGLSVIDFSNQKFEHLLGTRILDKPLDCRQRTDFDDKLICYLK